VLLWLKFTKYCPPPRLSPSLSTPAMSIPIFHPLSMSTPAISDHPHQHLPATVEQIPSMPRRIFFRPRSRRTCLATSRFSMYLKKRYSAVLWITTNVHPHKCTHQADNKQTSVTNSSMPTYTLQIINSAFNYKMIN